MIRLHAQLPGFQSALLVIPAGGGTPPTPLIAAEVTAFIRGIARKRRFVEMHLAVLNGVHWDSVESIGRRPSGAAQPSHLAITLPEARLTIEHADAVIDHVYAAFDGLTAAVVNMTDTMGRLINSRYSLGIDPKRASLLSLKNYSLPTSPIGIVVNDPRHDDWLKHVRDLRGRCQHADVENVVMAAEGPYACRGQPIIPANYCWQAPPLPTPIVSFAQQAVLAAEDTLLAVVHAIVTAPSNPLV